MAMPQPIPDREYQKFVESSTVANKPIVAVGNPDGTNLTGGTEYTEGDIDATITGKALMWEDASDTIRAVSAAKPLPVDIQDASVTVDLTGDSSDLDSAAGTDNHETFAIGVAASGGHATITGDATNGLDVDITRIAAGTNAIGKLAANSGVDIGDVDVLSIAAGTNLIGDVGIGVRTSGGATPFYNLDVDETEDAIKATAGQLYELYLNNTTAAQLFVKLYNATVATVVVGTTTPVMTIPVPANADLDGAGVVRNWPMGLAFGTAITIAATTGAADNDTGAPGTGAIIVSGGYA